MKLIKYGITLRRVTEDDLELLRNWRNSEDVNRFMEYRETITPEMQRKWFKRINNPDNFYYIIEYQGEKIGCINEKNYNEKGDLTTESGLFLAEKKYLSTHVPVCASLILIEVSFYFLNGKESYIHILKDNLASISYNKQLGYVLCPGQEEVENQLYVLTREHFEQKTRRLRKAAMKLSGNDPNIYFVYEKVDERTGFSQAVEVFLASYPIKLNKKTDADGNRIYYYNMNIDDPQAATRLDPEYKVPPIRY